MQLMLNNAEHLPRESFLRTSDTYWIEGKGLDDLISWVPHGNGFGELLDLLETRRSRRQRRRGGAARMPNPLTAHLDHREAERRLEEERLAREAEERRVQDEAEERRLQEENVIYLQRAHIERRKSIGERLLDIFVEKERLRIALQEKEEEERELMEEARIEGEAGFLEFLVRLRRRWHSLLAQR
jgi:hypothetical protein